MSQKALDDLRASIPVTSQKVADRISAFVLMIADMVATAGGNPVRSSDLATVLRMDPDSIGALIATDPPESAGVAPASLNPPRQGMRDADPVDGIAVLRTQRDDQNLPEAEKVVNPPSATGATLGNPGTAAGTKLPGSAGSVSNDVAGPDTSLGAPARNPSPKV